MFAHYDAVVAYATTGILPLLAEKRPYVAYEHGTIRSIPGGADRPRAALRLDLRPGRRDLHDQRRLDAASGRPATRSRPHHPRHPRLRRKRRSALGRRRRRGRTAGPTPRFGVAADVKVFLAPARHQWSGGDPGMFKGNDRIIRAAAMLARRRPEPFVLVFIEWGQEVELSRRLIDELALGDALPMDRAVSQAGLLAGLRGRGLRAGPIRAAVHGRNRHGGHRRRPCPRRHPAR